MAVQKAKIVSPEVEVYSEDDFDSPVLTVVHENESYLISNKTYGPFYRIKLNNGKVGYIVDYELDIEGKGRLKERDLDEVMMEEEAKAAKLPQATDEESEEEAQVFGQSYSGLTLQLINYHENTLGADQVDDLTGLGYKKIGDTSWSVLAAFKVPKYYTDKTGYSAKGLKLWGDIGFSNPITNLGNSEIRFSGSFFTQVSLIQLQTPTRKYDLHDITLGLALEVGWLVKFQKNAIDFAIKYYIDKSNYAGLGLSFLF